MSNFTLEHLKLIISGIISKFPRPDWKQDDSTHPNYIHNRTHYDISSVPIVSESQYKFPIPAWDYKITNIQEDLIVGQKYRIKMTDTGRGYKIPFLDKEYECVRTKYGNSIIVQISDFNTSENTHAPRTSAKEWLFYSSNGGFYINDSGYPPGGDQEFRYTISLYTLENVKQLDEKYIPDSIPKVSKAKKGQYLAVKEVDKKGKPTDWEATDITQVQADYAQTDSSKPDYILNKPTNLVKNTDYATTSKVGLVRTNTSYGTQMSGQYIQTSPASSSEVTSKSNNYKPITPKTVDYAVKAGLGNSSLTWNESEKTKARNVIDAASKSDLSNVQSSLNNIQNNLNNIESGKQSDWEQGDFDSPDFVKNRTHYDCNIKKVIKYNINYGGNLSDWTNKTNFSVIDESLHQKLLNTTINSTGVTLDGFNIDTPTNSWQYDIVTIKVTSYISLFVHLYYPLVYALNIDSPSGIQSTMELVWNYEEWELKQLDEKYIPDTIQRVSDTVKALENVLYVEVDDTIIFSDSGKFVINDDGDGNITITSSKIEVGDINQDVTITSSVLNIIDDELQNITIIEQ